MVLAVGVILLAGCQSASHKAEPPPMAGSSGPSPSAASPVPSVAPARLVPFWPAFRTYAASRDGQITAAVYDEVSGTTYSYQAGLRVDTASVIKVAIMAALLRNAELAHRSLTPVEASEMTKMIEASDNDAATDLWDEIGARDGMTAFLQAAGLSQTVTDPAGHWGLTQTTALDQVKLVKDFAFPSRFLGFSSQVYGISLLQNVIPEDDWGVSGGVPDGVSVALKNGWLPIGTADWIVNSVGYVQGRGRSYVIAILTRGSSTFGDGVQTIAELSTQVWNALRP
jgi:hypothetical protein